MLNKYSIFKISHVQLSFLKSKLDFPETAKHNTNCLMSSDHNTMYQQLSEDFLSLVCL